ncbi:hypothetical protein [Rasiella sp. SM2506]|uniref:hypothetical protein n=1 Tax=Rasiella sp. SM2506 TaxID=3423914 RepID=UPI003D7924ED
MKNLFTVLSLVFIFNATAQKGVDTPSTNDYLTNKSISINTDITRSGTPYAEENFKSGNIYKNGSVVASNVALRYNVLRDELEVKSSMSMADAQAKVLKRDADIYVRILNDVYVYMKPTTDDVKSGYFKVLHEGEKYHLYEKLTKEFIEGKKAINSVAQDVPPTYKGDEELYLVPVNGAPIELSGSRNRKLKSFPSHNKQLKKYVKENKLNINKDYSLEKLVAYYNTLK